MFPNLLVGSTCCVFRPAFRCAQHPKGGGNTQQPELKTLALESLLKGNPVLTQSLEQPREPGWIVLPREVGVVESVATADGGDVVAIAAAALVIVQGLVGAEGLLAFPTHEHLGVDKVWLFLKQKMKNVIKINGVRIWKPIIQYRKDHLAFDLWMQGSIS